MTNRNEFRKLGYWMVGLGVGVGLIFPPFMLILQVPAEIALRPAVFAATIACGIALGLFNIVLARAVVGKRVNQMNSVMSALAEGREVEDIPLSDNSDVFGDMARAIAVFRDHAEDKARLEHEQAEAERRISEERHHSQESLASDFENSIAAELDGAQADATSLQDAARTMGESSESSFVKTQSAIDLSDAAADGVNAVARSAEDLAHSVQELNSRMNRAGQMSADAVSRMGDASALVEELGVATENIQSVAGLIADIASQTNMLALNATIEAARAGDAGKGFAVVASEVKNLANQTAQATEDITNHITSIRTAGERARGAMGTVSDAIGEMNTIATEASHAVEEQTAAISEISTNARETATATGQSATDVREVAAAVEQAGFAAHDMLVTVDDLARRVKQLQDKAGAFVASVRD